MAQKIARSFALASLIVSTTACAQFTNAGNSPFLVGSSTSPISIVAADFDHDSIPDLAVANQGSNNISIFVGDGTGKFTLKTTIPLPAGAGTLSALAAGDFNEDGYPDLAMAFTNGSAAGAVYVWLNNLSVTISGASRLGPFPVGNAPDFIAVANLEGAHLDLAVANSQSGTVSVLLGEGTGNFAHQAASSPYSAGPGPAAIAVADFNGDGLLDLAISNTQLPSPPLMQTNYTVTVLLNQGQNGFVAAPLGPFLVGTDALRALVAADFNNDQIPDLAVAGSGGAVTVLLGNGAGDFTPVSGTTVMAGMNPVFMAAADFNGDRNADIAVVNNLGNVTVLLGNGAGGFTAATGSPYAVGSQPMSLAVADFNTDGKPDLAVVNYTSDDVSVLLNSINVTPGMMPATNAAAGAPSSAVAQGSIVTILGTGFGPGGALAPGSAVAALGAATVTIIDASSVKTADLPLIYISPTQINLTLPSTIASGTGTFSVAIPAGPVQAGSIIVSAVAPGLFSANGSGKGPATAVFVQDPLTAPAEIDTFTCALAPANPNPFLPPVPANCTPISLDVSGGNSFLILYGTGIRNRTSLSQVMVNIGGVMLTPAYAGAVTSTSPLDQVIVALPVSLIHANVVNAMVSIGNAMSNVVTLNFK